MEPGGGQAATTQGQNMPAGQELGPEATAHHLYLTDVCSEEKGVLQPPGPRGAQTQGPGRFGAGRQVGTAAQGIIMAAVPSCPSLPFALLSLPIQPSPQENKAQPQWATDCGDPTICASQVAPRKGGQGSQRCCIGGGLALEAAGPAWLEGSGRLQEGRKKL